MKNIILSLLLSFSISVGASTFYSGISPDQQSLLFSNVTTAERDALVVEEGHLVYNTEDQEYQYYDGTNWTSIGSGGGGGASQLSDLSDVSSVVYTNGYTLRANGTNFTASQLAHSDLSGAGSNTHAQIDSHISNTSNPHSVTAAQAGAVATSGNESISGIKTFNSLPESSATPTTSSQFVTKTYVDAFASGFSLKDAVKAATTANLTANYSNGSSGVGATLTATGNGAFGNLDGYAVQSADRILVKNQSTGSQNGIYTLTTVGDGSNPWVLTRSTDFDSDSEITQGNLVLALNGTAQANTAWAMNADEPHTLGTTSITWVQAPAQTSYTSGDGLDLSGTTFSADLKANDGLAIKSTELGVDYDDSSIGIVSNQLAVKSLGITNGMLAGSIADSKLSQITTASKVHGSSITGLASVPSGAGVIPPANLGSGTPDDTKFLRGDGAWIATSGGDVGTTDITYSKTLDTDVSPVTVSGTAAETSIYSYSVPANTLSTDKVLRLTMVGTYLNNSGANRTVTLRLKYGATTLFSRVTGNVAASATTGSFSAVCYLAAANSTSAQNGACHFHVFSGATLTQFLAAGGSSAIDSTSSQDLVVTAQHSNASASINLTIRSANLELVNASETIQSTFVPQTATLTDGATVAVDASLGNHFRLSAAGDRTILAPSNATHGQRMIIVHCASGGARTLTLTTGSSGAFIYGTDITGLTQTASGKCDMIGSIYDSTLARWLVAAYTKGY